MTDPPGMPETPEQGGMPPVEIELRQAAEEAEAARIAEEEELCQNAIEEERAKEAENLGNAEKVIEDVGFWLLVTPALASLDA